MTKKYQYIFGPVPSRRFGRSLGVDLLVPKTCSLDCVFCQLGRSRKKAIERREYVPTKKVIDELGQWLSSGVEADVITLSGSGEPTLHSRFGEVIEYLRSKSNVPVVLLTNGTMLHLPEVREGAALANVVKVSLSAWDQASYELINRPHDDLAFENLVEGERKFREVFKGELFLEVFLVRGINSAPEDVKRIAELARVIRPDRVQLNTAVRPPAENFVEPLSRDELELLAQLFDPPAEIIAEFGGKQARNIKANEQAILSMLERRPCTAEEIAEVFDMNLNEVSKYLGILMGQNLIQPEKRHSLVYYRATEKQPGH